MSFSLVICRTTPATTEQIVSALYKTRFLADQLQFAIHYEQTDDLRSKLSNILVDCLNITNRYCKILKSSVCS